MQRNDRLNFIVVMALAAAGKVGAAPVQPAAPASAAMPSSADVRSVGLGAKGDAVPTLKEWTDLQTRVQMKEMRDKLLPKAQTSGGGLPTMSGEQISASAPAQPASAATVARPRLGGASAPKDGTAAVATKPVTFDEEWTAKNALAGVRWVSTLTVGGVVRAEIITSGVTRRVAEGDEVVGWTVGSIKQGRVEMTKVVNRTSAFPGAVPQSSTIRSELVPFVDPPMAPIGRPVNPQPAANLRPPALPPSMGAPVMSNPDSTALTTPPPLASR
jgi:hypothetical protein